MPRGTVDFDPTKIDQEIVDQLKPFLGPVIAEALSLPESLPYVEATSEMLEEIKTPVKAIKVGQTTAHPTDFNPAPIEILIDMGHRKGRTLAVIRRYIEARVSNSGIVPREFLGEDQSCVWVISHDQNSFGFIPEHALLPNGLRVRTTKEIPMVTETYTEAGQKSRKWGVEGEIRSCSTGHGVSYEVRHDDESTGYYDPGEFEIISEA